MIKIEHITIAYQEETPVRDFSLHILPGEKVCLTGASGKGKSSILNTIPGFVIPESGLITVDGIAVSPKTIHTIREKTSWVPQSFDLDLENVEKLLLYPFSFKENRKKTPSRDKISELFSLFNLEESLMGKSLSEISGGQKQRIILCSVFLLDRPILLLDEPTSALDDESTKKVCDYILSLTTTTLLSVSHDRRWTERMDHCYEL